MGERTDYGQLVEVLQEMIEFVSDRGAEFYYEMREDLENRKPALSKTDYERFIALNAKASRLLEACEMSLGPFEQPLANAFELGQMRVRCMDSPEGTRIVFSEKWMFIVKSVMAQASELCTLSGPITKSKCRIGVKFPGDGNGTASVSIDGETFANIKWEAARYLEELIKAGANVPISLPQMRKNNKDLKDLTDKAHRLIDALPPQVHTLIKTESGKGSYLKREAWQS